MTRQIIVVDTETNGLDPEKHEPWEVAWHNLDTDESGHFFVRLKLPGFMANADLQALRINRFVDRYPEDHAIRPEDQAIPVSDSSDLRRQLVGNTLAGSNPSFDAAMLRKHFSSTLYDRGGGPAEPWHHRMWDLSAYAAGVLGLDELPGLAKVCELLDIKPGDHTAAGDVAATVSCLRKLRSGKKR